MCGAILKVKLHETIKTIAVDAYNRRLFYVVVQSQTYGSHRSRIVSASLDGNKRETLFNKESSFITALACDPYKKVLYYTDMHQKTLQAISYSTRSRGSPVTIISKGNIILYPSGLAWYENEAFIVNLGAKEAIRCQLYGARKCKAFNLNILNAEDILVDGSSRQPMNRNPCTMAKCQGMCIQSEFSYECMCGRAIVSENKPCTVSNEITNSSLLKRRPNSAHEDQKGSHLAPIIWTVVILLVVLACAVGYIFYHRKLREQRNFIRNLHFQNPVASFLSCDHKTGTIDSLLSTGTASSWGTTTASFEAKRETIQMGLPIQRLFRKSTTSHDTEIALEMSKVGLIVFLIFLLENILYVIFL